MSYYNDGSSFGYDEIIPYDEIPFSGFELGQFNEAEGKPILVGYNEYPQHKKIKLDLDSKVSEERAIIDVKETFRGLRNSIKMDDYTLILLFIGLMILVIQIKMFWTMDMMLRVNIAYQPHR